MRRLRNHGLALAALLGFSWAAVPVQQAEAAGTVTYKVWHWNIAGDAINYGSTTNGLVDAILGSLSARNPDFISLNEVCPDQYHAILVGLQAAGWPQSSTNFARFEPMPDVDTRLCGSDPGPNQQPYGVALFSRFAPTGTDRITLPSDGDKDRKLLCASIATQPGDPSFCTTHITFDDAVKQAQLDAVRAETDTITATGGTVIAAGDFNTQPNDPLLDNWYSPNVNSSNNGNNTGTYREFDDQDPICPGYGEQTTEGSLAGACGQPAKVDQIFAPERKLVSYTQDAHPIATDRCKNRNGVYVPCSDHRILDATVTLTTP